MGARIAVSGVLGNGKSIIARAQQEPNQPVTAAYEKVRSNNRSSQRIYHTEDGALLGRGGDELGIHKIASPTICLAPIAARSVLPNGTAATFVSKRRWRNCRSGSRLGPTHRDWHS